MSSAKSCLRFDHGWQVKVCVRHEKVCVWWRGVKAGWTCCKFTCSHLLMLLQELPPFPSMLLRQPGSYWRYTSWWFVVFGVQVQYLVKNNQFRHSLLNVTLTNESLSTCIFAIIIIANKSLEVFYEAKSFVYAFSWEPVGRRSLINVLLGVHTS